MKVPSYEKRKGIGTSKAKVKFGKEMNVSR
jgi:hypothetical protein